MILCCLWPTCCGWILHKKIPIIIWYIPVVHKTVSCVAGTRKNGHKKESQMGWMCLCRVSSLCSRRLEIIGTRKNGVCVSPSHAPFFSCVLLPSTYYTGYNYIRDFSLRHLQAAKLGVNGLMTDTCHIIRSTFTTLSMSCLACFWISGISSDKPVINNGSNLWKYEYLQITMWLISFPIIALVNVTCQNYIQVKIF